MDNPVKQFSELFSSPLGDLIASIGRGVGEAQAALDEGSLRQTLELYRIESEAEINEQDEAASTVAEKGTLAEERRLTQLIREIGYQPTFYVIPETEVEAKVSLNLNINNAQQANQLQSIPLAKYRASATPLNANNINQYNLNATAAATLKFKIVPVPTPSGVSDKRIMPQLEGRDYNNDTIALIASIGLSYVLTDSSKVLVENLGDNETLNILKQSVNADTIVDINDEFVLELVK